MATKQITPTTAILATSTVSGHVRQNRIHPTTVAATSVVRGSIYRVGGGPSPPYTPPYTPPTPPPTPPTPTIGTFAEAVYAQLNLADLLANYDPDQIVLSLLGAIGQAYQQLDALAHVWTDDNGKIHEQWANLMDLDNIPDEGLPWLGQFVGTNVDPSLDAGDQRQQILSHPGWSRGTVSTMTNAIQQVLTGTKTVNIVERDSSAYHFNVSTYASETPDQNLVIIAIENNKPAGLQYAYQYIGGVPGTIITYETLFNDYDSYEEVFDTYTTYEGVYTNP